ncbi:DUF1905 domain-containing protein [Myroides ceti]|uniref:DUF1905 domain-containing protein n=1 Tax=Paenimyroides ceti TaxID=395087 RepID=A0ABT8D1R0_9FLAO|nr:DUF1905 domain-containing protein [Paenimyroides ceti]MDN3710414.1 DUF1905 domain-containing protein [Paenimyroides ceti]
MGESQRPYDDFEISGYHLQPMGNGSLFLPVKAEIRKKIRKTAGDSVHVILYADVLPDQITEELQLCFKEEPGVYEAFMRCTSEKTTAYHPMDLFGS